MPDEGTLRLRSACPHDCPSGCSLVVERLSPTRIGRIRGAEDNGYTAGVVCAKVARYADRVHHPDRLTQPLRRVGAKGEGRFEPVSWDAALDLVADAFVRAAERDGPTAVWPYHSGGTMGLIGRSGLERLRNVMGYSRQRSTICMMPGEMGWRAGVGALRGVDPREMAEADLILVWGANPVSTQVNAMTHITRARRERGAKMVVVDCYRTPTVEQADMAIVLKPGTDAALAMAMMNVMLADGLADRDYLARFTDFDDGVAAHIATRTPAWASAITGVPEADIVALARLYGSTPRAFLRLGFGFTRRRNGSAAMHAVSCLSAVSGAWRHKGGGAFFLNWWPERLDMRMVTGADRLDTSIRAMDQSRIGAVLCGDEGALEGGPPVAAMLIQNANSASVAPDSRRVRDGLMRDDLFVAVHEQFMTPTAKLADLVLPATTFLEADDIYLAYGQTHLTIAPQVIDPVGEARPNHWLTQALARRLGAEHPGFGMTDRELVDHTLQASGLGSFAEVAERGWVDLALPFERAHFLDGFPHPDGRFRFRPDWAALGPAHAAMPPIADYVARTDSGAGPEHPFHLVTPPARSFLNSSFTETSASRGREGRPMALVHPDDADRLGLAEGATVTLGNRRGAATMALRRFAGLQRGTVIVEGIWPNDAFPEGIGINQLVGADPVPPAGGVAFHDTAVWLRPAAA
ncbi:MAG: molybdopterin-dependent oxidoreductase [Alphaproteobacteria bacterium]